MLKSSFTLFYLDDGTLGGSHHHSTYECVDKDPESVPGLDANSGDSVHFYHVEPNCSGLPCSPYDAEKELTCAVCSQ